MNLGTALSRIRKKATQRASWAVLAFACCVALPSIADAQQVDPQARAAARKQLETGDTAWERGDYETALDHYTRASEIVDAPTVAVRRAECLEKLGRLIEASEVYIAASRYELKPNSPKEHKQAVATAAQRAETVRVRIPTVVLTIMGGDIEDATVLVDDREIPKAVVDAGFPVDPGLRLVRVVKGDRTAEEKVTVPDGATYKLTIVLPFVAAEEKEEPAAPTDDAPSDENPQVKSSNQALYGWVALGVGVASAAVGTATLLVAKGNRNTLDNSGLCSGSHCDVSQQSTVDSYNRMKTVSTVGFAVGIVGIGAGVTLLLTAPAPQKAEVAGVRPFVGIGSAGVEGRF